MSLMLLLVLCIKFSQFLIADYKQILNILFSETFVKLVLKTSSLVFDQENLFLSSVIEITKVF